MENIDRKNYYNKAGIYIIKDSIKGRFYIGSSSNLYKRINFHMMKLQKNEHINKFMQNHYNKYGESSFNVEILEGIIDRKDRVYIYEREQFYLDLLFSDNCFNAHNKVIFAIDNKKNSERQRFFMKERMKNNPELLSKCRENLSLGRAKLNEIRQYNRDNGIKKVAHNKGVKISQEVKDKISKALENRGRYVSKLIPVNQYTLDGLFIKTWDCGIDAVRNLHNNNIVSNLYACCKGNRKSCMGFKWEYYKKI